MQGRATHLSIELRVRGIRKLYGAAASRDEWCLDNNHCHRLAISCTNGHVCGKYVLLNNDLSFIAFTSLRNAIYCLPAVMRYSHAQKLPAKSRLFPDRNALINDLIQSWGKIVNSNESKKCSFIVMTKPRREPRASLRARHRRYYAVNPSSICKYPVSRKASFLRECLCYVKPKRDAFRGNYHGWT